MMLSIMLAICLLTVLLFLYFREGRDPIAPSVLFCAGFAACSLATCLFSPMWNYSMSIVVFCVVLTGVLLFSAVAFLVNRVRFRKVATVPEAGWRLPYNTVYLVVLALFVIFVAIVSVYLIVRRYPADSLGGSISHYNSIVKFTDEGSDAFFFPWDKMRNLAMMAGYLFAYYAAQSLIDKKGTVTIVSIVGLLASCCSQVLSASRTMAVGYIFSFLVCYIILKRRTSGELPKLNLKTGVVALASIVFFLLTFQLVAQIMQGRNTSSNPFEYLSAYIGAQIPNLDTFLQGGGEGASEGIWGYMTFRNSIRWIGEKFGIGDFIYQYDLPFNTLNGVSTGNVYTTFYSFIYDFGMVGFVCLTILMAAVSQLVYRKCTKCDSGWASSIWIIGYSIVAYTLILSFFSNKFYENVFAITFVYKVLYLLILYVPLVLPVGIKCVRSRLSGK